MRRTVGEETRRRVVAGWRVGAETGRGLKEKEQTPAA